jgi:predicted DNA-binding transcriptional regulator AlpA
MARRYIRFKELQEEGVFANRMDAWRKVAAGFPAAIELGPNTVAWDRDEVEAWLAGRPRRCKKPKQADAPVMEAMS